MQDEDGAYYVSANQPTYEGAVDKIHSKLAFVRSPELSQDARVSRDEVGYLLHQDIVTFRIAPQKHGSHSADAMIVEIKTRGTHILVGTTTYRDEDLYVIPDGRRHAPIRIINPPAATEHKAQVRITQYPDVDQELQGEITQLFGPTGNHEAEMQSIIAAWQIPSSFETPVEESLQTVTSEEKPPSDQDLSNRKDLRDRPTCTIDPENAQDFDDALSLRPLSDDLWEVGIHIADVEHYVALDSAVDQEAQQRATSVYLVDRCLPMLPERLSNDLCSLRPNEDRLTYSLLLTMDLTGKVHDQWVGKAIIHSDKRLDYDQALEVLQQADDPWHATLTPLNEMAKAMRKQRFTKGGIEVHAPEFAFSLDDEGYPIEVKLKKWHDAHALIEEFMLLANRQIAALGKKLAAEKGIDFVYRTHAAPSSLAFDNLIEQASYLGYSLSCKNKNTPQGQIAYIQQLLQRASGQPEENIVQMLVIRSLAKAHYTTQIQPTNTDQPPIQHFGLGFELYTHFTSPIRRYPDLMVHRLLHALQSNAAIPKQNYQALCEHSTNKEIHATEAERASIKYKQAEYMDRHIGETFESMITGGNSWKLFVTLLSTGIEGIVPVSGLQDDYYQWDEKKTMYARQPPWDVLYALAITCQSKSLT